MTERIYPDIFDADDRTWCEGVGLPEAQIVSGMVTFIGYITAEGERRWRTITRWESDPAGMLGVVELGLHQLKDLAMYGGSTIAGPDDEEDDE